MNLTNYHSHCTYCDGKASAEEFVKSAIAAGFTAYGISSHAPLPFTTSWTMERNQVNSYIQEIEALKKKYAEQIEVFVGLEIDCLKNTQHPADEYFQQLPLDYRIGSVHLIYTDEGEVVDTDTSTERFKALLSKHFKNNLREVIECYYEASMQLVERGGFDFIGHMDKIAYNAECCDPGISLQPWYSDLREKLLSRIAEKKLILEINTKSYFTKGCFFPGRQHFEMIRELNIPIVVNSDAHVPERINVGRQEALKALWEYGFVSVCELHHGKWMEVPIELK